MTLEFDHMFVCTEVGAPEADRLVAFGLTEGTPNAHPGQGTANRRFLRNVYLELLRVRDEREARSLTFSAADFPSGPRSIRRSVPNASGRYPRFRGSEGIWSVRRVRYGDTGSLGMAATGWGAPLPFP